MDYDTFTSQEQGKETDGCLSNEVGVKGRFSVLQNDKGEIMLLMDAREGEPDDPRFIYDGSGTALLYRGQDSSIAFRNINEGAREPLKNAEEILVVEIVNDDVEREYIWLPFGWLRMLKTCYYNCLLQNRGRYEND